MVPGALVRHLPGVITRRAMLLVGRIVFFVQNHDAQTLHRGENGRTSAQHHRTAPVEDRKIGLETLPRRQCGMQKGEAVPENLLQTLDHLHRKRDLRHEQDGAPAKGERLLDQMDVDFRLARTRHTVQQMRGENRTLHLGGDLFVNRALLFV